MHRHRCLCARPFDRTTTSPDNGALFPVTVPSLVASVGVTYRLEAIDGAQRSTATDVNLCPTAINEAPVAVGDRFTVLAGMPLTLAAKPGGDSAQQRTR